jgi:hypothetical protein
LTKISDEKVNWIKKLCPILTQFNELAVVSAEYRFSVDIEFSDITGRRSVCQGHMSLLLPPGNKISEMGKILGMELEQACVRAVDFMLEDHKTTYTQQWDEVNLRRKERLEAEGQTAFLAGSAGRGYPRRKRGVLKREHAPWRITR